MRLSKNMYILNWICISIIGFVLIGNVFNNIVVGNNIFYIPNDASVREYKSLFEGADVCLAELCRRWLVIVSLIIIATSINLIYIYSIDIMFLCQSLIKLEKFTSELAINMSELEKRNTYNEKEGFLMKYMVSNKYDLLLIALNFIILTTGILSKVGIILISIV